VAFGTAVAAFLTGNVVRHVTIEGGAEFFVAWARASHWGRLGGLGLKPDTVESNC